MSGGEQTGGAPHQLGVCIECEDVYPVRVEEDTVRPVGTDGRCSCGGTEFRILEE